MSKLGTAQDRALELIGELGDGIRKAVPGSAMKWVETGAALGAVRTGTRIAGKLVRRNPVVAVAAALGVGVLAYAAHRKRKQEALNAPIEGRSRRIEAKRVNGTGKARKTTTASTRAPRARKTTAPSAEA